MLIKGFILGENIWFFFTNREYSSHFFETVKDLGEFFGRELKESRLDKINYYFWPTSALDEALSGLLHYNIWNGFTVYIRKRDYVDTYYFAGDKNSTDMINFYIKNLDFLKSFILFFNNKMRTIINNRDKNILGKHTGPIILDKFNDSTKKWPSSFIDKTKRIYLNLENKDIYLTAKEFKCLTFLSKGYTTKFAARKLDVFPRTLEKHIENLKHKIGIQSKDLLLEWFNSDENLSNLYDWTDENS